MTAPTPRTMLDLHQVIARCRACDHASPLDLAGLIARGHGDTPLADLPLVCRCGNRAVDLSVMGSGTYPYPSTPGR